jgi:hypothetical protein
MKNRIFSAIAAAALAFTVVVAPTAEAAASSSRVLGYVYSDAYYGGYQKMIAVTDYGDCDDSGYVITDTWGGSRFRQTSSISNSSQSPNCNAVLITTTYGGTVQMCIPTVYIGNAANDQVYKIRFMHRSGC